MKFFNFFPSTIIILSINSIQGALEDCLITNNCGSNIHCMAYCAGVPDPNTQQVSQTEKCINQCNGGPSSQFQTACNENCIIVNFQGFPNTNFQAGPARTLVPVSYSNPNRVGNNGISLNSNVLLTGLGIGFGLLSAFI